MGFNSSKSKSSICLYPITSIDSTQLESKYSMDLPKIWPGHKLPDAVLGGSIDELKDLLYQAPDAIDLIGPGGYTALHVAVFKD